MTDRLPYCGAPPLPGELLSRFNLDPALILIVCALAAAHLWMSRGSRERRLALSGWTVALVAFASPLCALSVSLFSARVAQHMLLLLVAAPLIGLALPVKGARDRRSQLWLTAAAFLIALWFWHMPAPYDATFTSKPLYWCMHITLFGSGILLWRELLQHRAERTGAVFVVGALTCVQMGFLGAVLALAARPLFPWHFLTTSAWGLTPLQDQQLGGTIMWVPGVALFLWAAMRSLERLWSVLEA